MKNCLKKWMILSILISAIVSVGAFASARGECFAETAGWYKGDLIKPYSEIDPEKASAVCESAVRENPDDLQMKALYCRALLKNDFLVLALEYCLSAADQDVGAMNLLGYIYSSEYQDVLESNTSFGWYERAANAGDSVGQYNAGRYLLYGLSKKIDIERAQYWLRAAARQGLPEAMLLLAISSSEHITEKQMSDQVDAAFNRFSATYGASQIVTLNNIKIYLEWLVKKDRYDRAVMFVAYWLNKISLSDEESVYAKIYLLTLEGDYGIFAGKKDFALDAYRDALAVFDEACLLSHSREWLGLIHKVFSLQRDIGTDYQLLDTALDVLDSLHQTSAEVGALKETVCSETKNAPAVENEEWLGYCAAYLAISTE